MDLRPFTVLASAWATVAMMLTMMLPCMGCVGRSGPKHLPEIRIDYNQAVAASADEQMLLNLVRLRHLHTPMFLELSSVVTQYSRTQSLGGSVNGNIILPGTQSMAPPVGLGVQGNVSATERPTVTYTPLQGEDFVQRLLEPISANTILLLVQSGWSIDVLLSCCVQRLNDLYPPPLADHDNKSEFSELARLLHSLQRRHILDIRIDRAPPQAQLVLRLPPGPPDDPELARALRLLQVDPTRRDFRVTNHIDHHSYDEVALRGRSLMSAMFYLSQGVAVPADDAGARQIFDEPKKPMLRVRFSERPPENSFTRVYFQGRWYSVDQDDLRSKQLFVLLQLLFSLTSAPGGDAPILTVPLGG